MSDVPREPDCPPDRKTHRDRVAEIVRLLPPDKVAAVVIDDTPEHREWYLYALTVQSGLVVVDQGKLFNGAYCIKVRRSAGAPPSESPLNIGPLPEWESGHA